MWSSGFCYPSGAQGENERKWTDKQIIGSFQKAIKAVKYEGDSDTNSI